MKSPRVMILKLIDMHSIRIPLIILIATSIFAIACGSNTPSKESGKEMENPNFSKSFLDEENYFIATTEENSKREQIALSMAEAKAVQSIANQIDDFILSILEFYENLEISDESSYPTFAIMQSEQITSTQDNQFSKKIEFKESLTEEDDGDFHATVYGRFPKKKLPELITPQRFLDSKQKQKFIEQGGIEWLKERVKDELNLD